MQLKKPINIRGALALATCATLHGTAQAAEPILDQWKVDSAFLYYGEKDRVDVFEPAIFASKQLNEAETLTLRGVFDTMSGATPNGAVTSSVAQTFTSPSGNAYTVSPNELPTMDFNDQRGAIGFDWEKRTSRLVKRTLSGDLSAEGDYSSIGGSLSYAFDNEDRLRTFAVGVGLNYDLVNPNGGKPTELARMSTYLSSGRAFNSYASRNGEFSSREDDEGGEGSEFSLFQGESKVTASLLLGVTQVLSREALLQLNYTRSQSGGYLNDPYKLVSLVDNSGTPLDALFEKRPDTRGGNALFAKLVYHLPQDVVHLSYRYYTDDWGITSHTGDIAYRMELWGGGYLQPHLRYYRQSQADFYHSALLDSAPLPDYASADYRLAEMKSTTTGLKLGLPMGKHAELALRAEFMKQTGDSHPSDAIGNLQQIDLYPGLEATIFQISYTTEF
jgi:hypothetical protein